MIRRSVTVMAAKKWLTGIEWVGGLVSMPAYVTAKASRTGRTWPSAYVGLARGALSVSIARSQTSIPSR
jgi:hypothetical protein